MEAQRYSSGSRFVTGETILNKQPAMNVNVDKEQHSVHDQTRKPDKKYTPPEITAHGTIQTITNASTLINPTDADFGFVS